MIYRDIIFSLISFLAFAAGFLFLYCRTFIFFRLYALRVGLDHRLAYILKKLLSKRRICPPSKIFRNSSVLDLLLKDEIEKLYTDFPVAADSREYILDLYKIKQVVDFHTYRANRLTFTGNLPLDAEIFVLQYKLRLPAEIISNEKKTFSLLIEINAESEKTYISEFAVKEGDFLELIYSVGVMEEYHFSVKVKSVEMLSAGMRLVLAHTREISSLFYRRSRQKDVNICDLDISCIFCPGNEEIPLEDFNKFFENCSVVGVSMTGCVLRMEHLCEEGLHITIGFSVNDVHAVYYGRLGRSHKEHSEQGKLSYLTEVQFIQSTGIGLANLGELVYGFRGT